MKRIRIWISMIASIILVIDWGVLGVKLLDGNYNITIEGYIALISLVILFICAISKVFTDKCPHCGKLRTSNGKFCPHCGKEI